MKRPFATVGLIVACVLFGCSTAYPWGAATHAYIADQLNKKLGRKNQNETYGAMTPDMFNFSFELGPEAQAAFYYQLHYLFDNLWNQKKTGMEKGLGYGFISHNDAWGADFTAHHSINNDIEGGYVIVKAEELALAGELSGLPSLFELVGEGNEAVAEELYHVLVEFGLDILTKQIDPAIGQKIASAAMYRTPKFPSLLVEAYAQGFADFLGVPPEVAAGLILDAEQGFRGWMVVYGQTLMLDDAEALWAVSESLADLAYSYLDANEIPLELPPEVVVWIIGSYLQLTVDICQTDYPAELNATVDHVDEEMTAGGIGNRQ